MTRILIVDDHLIARRGLEHVLAAAFPDARFGEASDAAGALTALSAEAWDVALVDIHLRDRDGLDLVAEVRRRWPALPVLVVSAYPEEHFAVQTLRLGAAGYVSKESEPADIAAAVRKARSGGRWVSAALAERLASAVGGAGALELRGGLSARELQVLRLVAQAWTQKQIAAELHLSEKTVATYRARIAHKLGLSTKVELTRYALQHGLAG
jgi:two-component system invasion response regulator UvrY